VQLLGSQLSKVMLIAIEVAVEYWLALTWSPQAQWLNEDSKSGVIQNEASHCTCACLQLLSRDAGACRCFAACLASRDAGRALVMMPRQIL